MDLLKAEIARKREAAAMAKSETGAKYFKRGDLQAAEEEKYLQDQSAKEAERYIYSKAKSKDNRNTSAHQKATGDAAEIATDHSGSMESIPEGENTFTKYGTPTLLPNTSDPLLDSSHSVFFV